MKKLEFTVAEMHELVKQGDALWVNNGNYELSIVGRNV
jgi:hypothetical protein